MQGNQIPLGAQSLREIEKMLVGMLRVSGRRVWIDPQNDPGTESPNRFFIEVRLGDDSDPLPGGRPEVLSET